MKFKFEDIGLSGWILIGVLLLCAAILYVIARSRQKWTPLIIATAAVCIALSFVLSYIRLFRMPQGGSITPASLLPIVAFAYYFGPVPGLVTGLAYGLLQMLQDAWIVGPAQALLDYPLAYGCIVFAGLAGKLTRPQHNSLPSWTLAVFLTGLGRFICHTLSGVVFFASYADGTGLSPLVYSLTYNLYVFIDLGVCLVITAFPQVRGALKRMTASRG